MHVQYKYYLQAGFTACNAPYNSDACPQLQARYNGHTWRSSCEESEEWLGRQCTYNVTLKCVHANIVAVEKQ